MPTPTPRRPYFSHTTPAHTPTPTSKTPPSVYTPRLHTPFAPRTPHRRLDVGRGEGRAFVHAQVPPTPHAHLKDPAERPPMRTHAHLKGFAFLLVFCWV